MYKSKCKRYFLYFFSSLNITHGVFMQMLSGSGWKKFKNFNPAGMGEERICVLRCGGIHCANKRNFLIIIFIFLS